VVVDDDLCDAAQEVARRVARLGANAIAGAQAASAAHGAAGYRHKVSQQQRAGAVLGKHVKLIAIQSALTRLFYFRFLRLT